MNIDWDEIMLLAQEVDSDDPESLAKLFVDLLQCEYSARNTHLSPSVNPPKFSTFPIFSRS